MPPARDTRPLPALLAAAVLLTLASAPGSAATATATVDEVYALAPGSQVVVKNVNGNVQVGAWDRDEARVVAHKQARAGSRSAAEEHLDDVRVRVTESAGRLEIVTELPRSQGGWLSWLFGGDRHSDVSYEITLPRRAQLTVSTVNGNVDVEDMAGRIDASSTNGRIEMRQVGGEVDASSINGSITVDFRQVAAGARMEFSTVNGSITLYAPRDLEASIDARTTNGSVSSDLPMTVSGRRSRSRLVGDVNGGGGTIRLRTTNGSVRLKEG